MTKYLVKTIYTSKNNNPIFGNGTKQTFYCGKGSNSTSSENILKHWALAYGYDRKEDATKNYQYKDIKNEPDRLYWFSSAEIIEIEV